MLLRNTPLEDRQVLVHIVPLAENTVAQGCAVVSDVGLRLELWVGVFEAPKHGQDASRSEWHAS